MPCTLVRALIELSTDLRVWGLSGDGGVDCKLVRTSSRGDATVVINVRARIPAVSGTNAGEGIMGGSTTRRRWSYVNI